MRTLVVVAHPDDEILWFYSVLSRTSCDVICVTNGRDEADRRVRMPAFQQCMQELRVGSYRVLDHADTPKRLDLARLAEQLREAAATPYDQVYTHGPWGEVHGNRHHQDVCYAVHQAFDAVHSVAWNTYPDAIHTLTTDEYARKQRAMGTLYASDYRLLKMTHEISPVEKFVVLSREAVDIFYWGNARFGDHHEHLARYPDVWGFQTSQYEQERHAAITAMVGRTTPSSILEFGSCEGVLTRRLSETAAVTCVESAPSYRRKLTDAGFTLADAPDSQTFDVSVVASFLEYVQNPIEFLLALRSTWLVVELVLNSELDRRLVAGIAARWQLHDQAEVLPSWEPMRWGATVENLSIYRLGAHVYCFKRLDPAL